jgi:hypothetical protein
MASAFLDVPLADIIARIQAIANAAAGGPVVVRLGEEVFGYRNVGVDVPVGRRSAAESRRLRARVTGNQDPEKSDAFWRTWGAPVSAGAVGKRSSLCPA